MCSRPLSLCVTAFTHLESTSSVKWCLFGTVVISLPVNDDWVRGCLISVATTFLLTAAAEWMVEERKQEKG